MKEHIKITGPKPPISFPIKGDAVFKSYDIAQLFVMGNSTVLLPK
jgi:hypothetical protein